MKDCLFCKIVKKNIKSNIVSEDENFLVFMDKFPTSKGHMLIVPKKHILDAMDMDDDTFKKMNDVIQKMMKIVYKKLNADGIILTQNNGVCQEIKHYHMHLIPKYNNEPVSSDEEIYQKLIE